MTGGLQLAAKVLTGVYPRIGDYPDFRVQRARLALMPGIGSGAQHGMCESYASVTPNLLSVRAAELQILAQSLQHLLVNGVPIDVEQSGESAHGVMRARRLGSRILGQDSRRSHRCVFAMLPITLFASCNSIDGNYAGVNQLVQQLKNIGAKLRFVHLVFLMHLFADPPYPSMFDQELPDTRAHVVEAEIAFAVQVQKYRFAIELLHQYIRRRYDDRGKVERSLH